MKSPIAQRDETMSTLCDVLAHIAENEASYTAQSFVQRARANLRMGNFERAAEYAKIAKSYIVPERVTV